MAVLRPREPRTSHAAGIFADMSLDGPHIGTLVVVIDRAKNLPNRRAIGKQDPYCAMRLGKEAKKTLTDRRGGQTPKWDTELRFNVHDSPDYLRLKTSIFNDDKKTDLIGEAWVELGHVVKRGGGQADLWQQLTCKGKYAGELRVELTYYDSRERPAPTPVVSTERRRVRETIQAFSGAEDMVAEPPATVSRHIGPREIRRRPLPTGPTPLRTPAPSAQSDHQRASSLRQLDSSRRRDDHIHAPVPLRPRASPEPDGFETQHNTDYMDQQYDRDGLMHADYHDLPSAETQAGDISAYGDQRSYSENTSSYNHHFVPEHLHSDPSSPYGFPTAPMRPGPLTTNSDSKLQHLRHDPRSAAFRDSPLRHSTSHQTTLHDLQMGPAPPPIPPKHRETPPRRSQTDLPPSAYASTPSLVANSMSLIGDRSPLQSLEDTYLTHVESHDPYSSLENTTRFREEDYQTRMHNQRMAWQERAFVPMPEVQAYKSQARPHQQHDYGSMMVDEPQSLDEICDSSYVSDKFQPSVEDAPSSPGMQPAVQRKALGDQPKKLSSVPFNPDSYEALNPGPTETTVPSHEQAREAQRMREVEKLRDLGPIIGNDGRVIDPSDHLPSDTWAPEPEWKNKKPEHVIHVRSRNGPTGARPKVIVRHNGSANFASTSPVSSPASADRAYNRTTAVRQQGTRPLPTQPYPSPLASSPASIPAANTNTNFPPVAARPRPASRRVSWNEHDLVQEIPPVPLHPRIQKRSSWVERPDRSEYQVSPTNSHSPLPSPQERAYNSYRERTNPMKLIAGHEHSSSPTSRPQSRHRDDDTPSRQHSWDAPVQQPDARQTYRESQYDDPLAAELSTIDLGPSRHTGRNSHGHRTSTGMDYRGFNQQQQPPRRQQIYSNDARGMSMPALNVMVNNNNRSMVRSGRS